jgi:HAD superfamily hydrolase (TIGR01459 family)
MLNPKALEAIEQLNNNSKKIVFLSNAPRPSSKVINFLLKMKMNKKYLSNVMTSGEAAMHAINKKQFGKTFFHLGPTRDTSVFEKVKDNKTSIDNCDFILCTGLFDEHDKDLKFYKELFEKNLKKKMICTNPDLIVDRGNKRELCAGSVAMVYEKMGGNVVYFGKPYPEVYNQSFDIKNKKILSIGDNLNTDIKGANLLNFDSLIISNGIHKDEIREKGIDETSKSYEAICNYIQSELKW